MITMQTDSHQTHFSFEIIVIIVLVIKNLQSMRTSDQLNGLNKFNRGRLNPSHPLHFNGFSFSQMISNEALDIIYQAEFTIMSPLFHQVIISRPMKKERPTRWTAFDKKGKGKELNGGFSTEQPDCIFFEFKKQPAFNAESAIYTVC